MFNRRRNRQLTCNMHLTDPNHVHTEACYMEIMPLMIVELFQSQGCRSCPPAIPTIHRAVNGPNLLLLTYNVTYWNNPDWADTFSNPAWDQRQRQYIVKWGRTGIFTPHVIADGVTDGVGARNGEVASIVARARDISNNMAWSINIDRDGDTLVIKSDLAESETFDVVIVSYDPKPQVIKVTKGTNKGKKVPHQNVVKDIQKIGEWKGGEVRVQLPAFVQDGLERIVLVQGNNGGAIVGTLKV